MITALQQQQLQIAQVLYALDHNPAHVCVAANLLHEHIRDDVRRILQEMFDYSFHDVHAGKTAALIAIYGYGRLPNNGSAVATIFYSCQTKIWVVLP